MIKMFKGPWFSKLKSSYMNLPFMRKLMLSYLIVILIPLVIWSTSSYIINNAIMRERLQDDFNNTCAYIINRIQNKIDKINRALQQISRDETVSQIVNQNFTSEYEKLYNIRYYFDSLINNMYANNPELEEFKIYTYGNIKGARESFLDIEQVTDEHVLRQLKSGIDPLWLYDGETLTVSDKIIYIPDPMHSATITIKVNKDYLFSDNFPDQNVDFRMIVTDMEAQVIYDLLLAKQDTSDIRELGNGSSGILYSKHTMPDVGWNIELLMDVRPLMFSLSGSIINTSLLIALSFAILLAIGYIFSRTFVKRIEVLNQQLGQVVPSEFTIDIRSEYTDEIGEITNSVGSMVRETRQLIEEVYKSRLAQRDAQIIALQSQINPHFLYNTLSNLNWRAIRNGDTELSDILTSLSRFYRLSLNDGMKISTIGEELQHVKAYLKIQNAIFEKGFTVDYDIDTRLVSYTIPAIILQPIVENAIEHGIMPIGYENGRITITLAEQDENIIIKIADNGPGMDKDTVASILGRKRKGYGLYNVDKRLKLFFDDRYGLAFEETPGGGTTVVITIPKIE
ncbi:MAG TPA: sensor histidine kinase [Candidatus Atribacteria bacterium]|nr:sensor histidine kinase [Candidatus Atribacteria bacterium]